MRPDRNSSTYQRGGESRVNNTRVSRSVQAKESPSEENIRAERLARRQANLQKKRKRKIRKIFNYVKLATGCLIVVVFLAVFVFKTPIETGTQLLQEGDYEGAIEKYTEGLSDIDYIAESYKGIGIAYFEMGQYKDAIDNLENAIQKGQTSQGTTYYLLAISYMETNNYDKALENIIIALTRSGNSMELTQELRFNEVLCLELTSDWEGAKAKATSYMQAYPDDTAMKTEYKFLTSR